MTLEHRDRFSWIFWNVDTLFIVLEHFRSWEATAHNVFYRGDCRSHLGPLGEIETRSSKHPSRFEMGRHHLTSKTAEISLEIVGRDKVEIG
jgi:hypothetical protein